MPRVTYVTSLHSGLAWGGLEIQADRTAVEMGKLGWEVEFLTSQTREVGELAHFFGRYDGTWPVALQLRDRGVPWVCSPVFLTGATGLALRLRGLRKRLTDETSFKGQRRLFNGAQRLFTLSAAEDRNLDDYFGALKPAKYRVVNGVEPVFSQAGPEAFPQAYGIAEPFVLCTGRVEPRKGQREVLAACRKLGMLVVIVGKAEGEYAEACRQSGAKATFLEPIPANSELLASAYAACSVFAMPSQSEVLSLSALEAACAGAPVVLGDSWGAQEHFGDDARYVPYGNADAIAAAIDALLKNPGDRADRSRRFADRFSWEKVAKELDGHYRAVLERR